MKTVTCTQMGGSCDAKISGNSKEEIINNGMKHLQEKHPEMAETMKNTPKDDPSMVEWNQKFNEMYDAAPEEADETEPVVT